MYCRILKRGGENIRRLNGTMNSKTHTHTHTPVHNQVSVIVAYAGPHVPEVSVGGLRVRPENFSNPARQGENNVNMAARRHPGPDIQELQFSHPFWKIMKLVRRVRSGARKLESFRSFWRKRTPNEVFYTVPPKQRDKT